MADRDIPLDHIYREQMPWRINRLTECGRPASDVAAVIDRDTLLQRMKQIGKQRTAFTVCMTCADRVKYAKTWAEAPVDVIRRECERAGWNAGTADGEQFTRELRAIAALIGEHRAEFDGYLSGLGDTIDLRARRLSRKAR